MKTIVQALALSIMAITLLGCQKICSKDKNCLLAPDPGNCLARFPKYYFDQEEGKCKEFIWGGCDGVVPFHTLEACQECECH